MGKIRILFVLGLIAGLSGCGLRSMLDHIAPETVGMAKTNFDLLRHGQFDRIVPSLDASIDRDGLTEKLAAMAALVPKEEPVSVKTVGAFGECDSRKGCDTRVTLEYEFPSKWLLVELVAHSGNGKSTITNFHVQSLSQSMEQANRFTLRGKSAIQYTILVAALITAGLTVWALVLCIRTPMARRKWLWIIFILIGIGRVGVNWTTGELFHNIAWFNLLPVGTYGQPYGPWIITLSIPIGAILFFVRRDHLRKPSAPVPGADEAPPALTSA